MVEDRASAAFLKGSLYAAYLLSLSIRSSDRLEFEQFCGMTDVPNPATRPPDFVILRQNTFLFKSLKMPLIRFYHLESKKYLYFLIVLGSHKTCRFFAET